ncbi:MAG TPA: hypothetical protein VGK00_07410 [Anaerolineales bacterium]|jgi:hypothetical protein
MKIADNTPYRNSGGVIDIFGRLKGTLKFGLSWYDRMKAQDVVVAVFDKILGPNFVLLRNVYLHNTDIDLPLVLIGPPGLTLINVTHETGVYRAKGDEWGAVSGDKFVPAPINLVKRTATMGRVLQFYLDKAGYKGGLTVESILMAADPGMHIESDHPAGVRIVLSDALERFANSLNQMTPVFSADKISQLANVITKGPKKKPASQGTGATAAAMPAVEKEEEAIPPAIEEPDVNVPTFTPDALGFSFSETGENQSSRAGRQAGEGSGSAVPQLSEETGPSGLGSQLPAGDQPVVSKPNKRGWLGMTRTQLLILAGILLVWLIALAAFGVYIYINLNV